MHDLFMCLGRITEVSQTITIPNHTDGWSSSAMVSMATVSIAMNFYTCTCKYLFLQGFLSLWYVQFLFLYGFMECVIIHLCFSLTVTLLRMNEGELPWQWVNINDRFVPFTSSITGISCTCKQWQYKPTAWSMQSACPCVSVGELNNCSVVHMSFNLLMWLFIPTMCSS